jgi:glutamate dehydrogenase
LRLVAHPIISVERNAAGKLEAINGLSRGAADEGRESLIQIHLDPLTPPEEEKLRRRLDRVLRDVRMAVEDWRPMMAAVEKAIENNRRHHPPIDPVDFDEAVAFLRWLIDRNFVFLGARFYDFSGPARSGKLNRAKAPGLGVLTDPDIRVLRRGGRLVSTTPEIREFLSSPDPLIITKANVRSHVHRRRHLDYVGIKLYGRGGKLSGELRIVGLFTSSAYHRSVQEIPYLRRKVEWVMARSGLDPDSHSGKALLNILESYPRDELFQTDRDLLLEFARDMLRLDERPRVRIFMRRDKFDRFVSLLVFVPRDRYSTNVRVRIGAMLAQWLHGHVSFYEPTFLESHLVRIHFIIGRSGHAGRDPMHETLEENVREIIRTWQDGLLAELRRRDPDRAAALYERYASALPDAYQEDFPPAEAAADLPWLEGLTPEEPIHTQFHREAGMGEDEVALKILHLGPPIALAQRVPVLENFGFRSISENTYRVTPADAEMHVHDMALKTSSGHAVDIHKAGPALADAFHAIWRRQTETDPYDALIVNAGLGWREVALLRTVSRYLRQAGIGFSQRYMATTLGRHPAIAAALVSLFRARLMPSPDKRMETVAAKAIETGLADVQVLDEDRIIRRFADVVRATLRTNFFSRDEAGAPIPEIAIKLDSRAMPELPDPKPYREIFMHSPRLEAVHLRFGAIARGGIRWSDRPEDFRTEVLGLVKAQQVKNAVIVPVGAKGGFVPSAAPGDRAAGEAAYRVFIDTLLSLTDNLVGGKVVPPEDILRRDGDDPYLVVAADKGTATFSDLANGIAENREFWLGDAFASGGSAGFDHKEMGITARGAFEAVKRHFREMDQDITRTPFTVAGVGDMSGDVFGNGMLLLKTTRLVAAFDHRDIFIDPDPDLAASFVERKRLFKLPRSSWQDYDRKKLSAGGGVFSRSLKSIPLSAEARRLLGLSQAEIAPPDLMRAILSAKVDLLYFGGIGTFIRGEAETSASIGDRANDAIRISASAVGAKVIGEGANLGMTERARIEYGLKGGRSNSDAIDNSAGVNTSDVEVNIKIAFAEPLRSGRIKRAERDRMLAAMTGEVAALVLRNNYLQPLAISLAERRGMEDFPFQRQMIQALEKRGFVDRRVDALPDDAALAERAARGIPLTRPEIGLLLAHAKLALVHDLDGNAILDDAALAGTLHAYFPQSMRRKLAAEIDAHRLRREIIATQLANFMINRGGPSLIARVGDRTGAGVGDIACAVVIAAGVFETEAINDAIDALDGKLAGKAQLGLYGAVEDMLLQQTVWFARRPSRRPIEETIAEYRKAVAQLQRIVARDRKTGDKAFDAAGIPRELAHRLSLLAELGAAPEIHMIATAASASFSDATEAYFTIGGKFAVDDLERRAAAMKPADYYEGLAIDRALRRLADARRSIAVTALKPKSGRGGLAGWLERRAPAVERTIAAMRSAATDGPALTPARLSVIADLLGELATS